MVGLLLRIGSSQISTSIFTIAYFYFASVPKTHIPVPPLHVSCMTLLSPLAEMGWGQNYSNIGSLPKLKLFIFDLTMCQKL